MTRMLPEPQLVERVDAAVKRRNARLLSNGEIAFTCPSPELHANGDAHSSARWNRAKAVWWCDVCEAGDGMVDLARRLGVVLPPDGRPPQRERSGRETIYAIRDGEGTLVAEHVRIERCAGGKRFTWRLPDGRSGLDGLRTADLPLYGAHELASGPGGSLVVLVEGERARDALVQRGILAVGTVTGASVIPSDDVLRPLVGYAVVLWPDADAPGRAHMQRIAARLTALGSAHVLLDPWAEKTAGEDAADWIGTTAELRALLDATTAAAAQSSVLASTPPESTTPPDPVGVLVADVPPEAVRWLWYGRLPLGKLVILEGRPDEGKTTLALDLAARVSTGAPMPCETTERVPRGVVVLTAEDGLADTIRPRLEAAGADLGRIVAARPEELPTLDEDGLAWIRAAIARVEAALVILDPLMAFVPDAVDTHRDHHSRRLLRKLSALAEELAVTIVVLRHLRKGAVGDPRDAGGGSVAFVAAARVVLLAAADPDDESRKVLARQKGNLAPPFPAFGYRLVAAGAAVRVEWLGETSHTAAALLAVPLDENERAASDEAADWLVAFLGDGPRPAGEVLLAAKKAGISERTLRRVKVRTGVMAHKEEGTLEGRWYWALPDSTTKAATMKAATSRDVQDGSLRGLGSLRHSTGVFGTPRPPENAEDCQGCHASVVGSLRDLVVRCLRCGGDRWWPAQDGDLERCVACGTPAPFTSSFKPSEES
jgi:hypothetical protein